MKAALSESLVRPNRSQLSALEHSNMKRHLWIASLAIFMACGGKGERLRDRWHDGYCGHDRLRRAPPGTSGATGRSGTTGGAGTTGSAGTTGGAGATGAAGTTGTPGTAGAAGTTGGAGTTGSAGRGGTTGTAGTTGAAGTTGRAAASRRRTRSVLERNKNPSRDGHFIQPTLTKTAAATMMADTAFNTAATFTGNVAAAPAVSRRDQRRGLVLHPHGER